MNIVFPSTTDIIDGIRGAVGRQVTFYTVTYSGCSVCNLDPVTNTSTDSFCEACSGVYWIPTYSGYTISGHITWNKADTLGWAQGGQIFTGDCRLQIKYSNTVATIVDTSKYVVVDGKKLRVADVTLRGTPTINRMILSLSEQEKTA